VDNPLDAAPFLPQLLPGLEKVSNEVADPECRSVAARAAKELVRVANEGKTGVYTRGSAGLGRLGRVLSMWGVKLRSNHALLVWGCYCTQQC
jgi:hypothetical protein